MNIEKYANYFVRTFEHINRVQRNMLTLILLHQDRLGLTTEQCREAMYNVLNHDRSKFSPEQFEPYVELTEYHRQRRTNKNYDYEYPSGVKELVDQAIENHYQCENHHPQRLRGILGKYTQLEAIETVCDLQAMAQEFGEGTCRKYFEEVWKPTQSQYFYDDYNWECVVVWMDEAIKCFEDDPRPVSFLESEL